jgi:uncharacterized protein (TIGR02147 family)
LGHHIVTFHRTMLERAAEALDTCERDDREIAGLTLGLARSQMVDFKRRVYEFRQELLQLAVDASKGEQPTDVVQINFQLFPMTQRPVGDDEP